MNASHDALRARYIAYFAEHGHTHIPSSSLLPHNDPSLMFVNAGMVQFKDVFVGQDKRPYSRAVSCQKCMRVSGKHNDLEEVGRTARHHTLFEMLGNFSFGDYFKEEAIKLAWDFVVRELGLDAKRMWVTVHGGNDQVAADTEARALWRKISGLPDSRILDMGDKDNFWTMGEVGPCGPCTEIHFDQGSGPVTPADFESGRVMEIWNVVFMQYQRALGGALTPLPKPCVDTGMGLERVLALTAGADSNYHTDLFMPLIETVAERSGKPYGKKDSEDDVSMRVIADHARALAFLVADGVQPSNEGKGYVLRRIVRRAIRHGRRLGLTDVFMPAVTAQVVRTMGAPYPELNDARALIEKVAEAEEVSFRRTLDSGLKMLGEAIGGTLDKVAQGPKPVLSGEVMFKLYDTYGFPRDLTEVIAQERGIEVDAQGFDAAMAEQQARSRQGMETGTSTEKSALHALAHAHGPTPFIGFHDENGALPEIEGGHALRRDGDWVEAQCTIQALLDGDYQPIQALSNGAQGYVLLDATPLYAEGGGQVGDGGRMRGEHGTAQVLNAVRPLPTLNLAAVQVTQGTLSVGDTLWAGYRAPVRLRTRAHHSATHLLHHALREVLGEHVKQAGSLVDAEHLRFDFSHFSAMTDAQIAAVEDAVHAKVAAHVPVCIEELDIGEARKKGAIALFGEKYGERVRVISMGESIEFCGGTHVSNTQDVGLLLVTREQAVQSGVRRIEAEVGDAALARIAGVRAQLAQAAQLLGAHDLHRALSASSHQAPHEDTEAQAVLGAIARTRSRVMELNTALQAVEGPTLALSPEALGLDASAVPQGTDLKAARNLRDTWQALVQLSNARAQEGPKILERLGDRDVGHLAAAWVNLLASEREAERFLSNSTSRAQAAGAQELVAGAETLANGLKLITHSQVGDGKTIKEHADHLRQALGSGVVALAAHEEGRVTLLVALTPDLVGRLSAGALVKLVAPHIEGRGGGRPDLAQAGGRRPEGIVAAFVALKEELGRH